MIKGKQSKKKLPRPGPKAKGKMRAGKESTGEEAPEVVPVVLEALEGIANSPQGIPDRDLRKNLGC